MGSKSEEISDDEDDYMSETFIQQAKKNTIPGLVISQSIKRKHEIDKREKDTQKPLVQRQLKCLEEGLSKPIDSSNKGFKLMQKMGYVDGTTLGLSQSSNAIKSPIGINLKRDRSCLGKEEHLSKVKLIEKSITTERFISNIREKFQENFLKKDLRKSLRACYHLDTDAGLKKPVNARFWPETLREFDLDSKNEEINEEINEENVLKEVTLYLRSKHFYCIWCGIKFENIDDLKNCPGGSRAHHD